MAISRGASSALAVAAAAAALSTLGGAAAQSGDLAVIKERLLATYVITQNVTGADEDVTGFLPLVAPDGSFTGEAAAADVSGGGGGGQPTEVGKRP
jgi:hypothetical protein